MILLDHISLSFKNQQILTDLSAHVNQNEMVGISGRSGCGKSTLLKALLGFVPLDSGRIVIDNMILEPASVRIIRQKTAYLPQDLNFPVDTVREMVQILFQLQNNRSVTYSKDKMFFFWDMLGLEQKLYERKMHKLSGGQRQRILLSVMAMLQKPICLIDEPTSALDADASKKVGSLLGFLKHQGGTMIVVSHDKLLLSQCDRIINL